MKADSVKYEFTLDNQFFVDLDGPEVQKGKLTVELNVKKTSGVFLLDFQLKALSLYRVTVAWMKWNYLFQLQIN